MNTSEQQRFDDLYQQHILTTPGLFNIRDNDAAACGLPLFIRRY